MPAKDLYHDCVRNALVKDGWIITHDPYRIAYGNRNVYADLGAVSKIGAEREGRSITVEVKSFLGTSGLVDFERALGQYVFCRSLLRRVDPGRGLHLAVTERAFDEVFSTPIVRPALEDHEVRFLVFRIAEERIVRWLP